MRNYIKSGSTRWQLLRFAGILLITMWFPFKGNATIWYAAPNGTGNGAFGTPFGLQAAFNSALILPGDILYLRGNSGPYTGRFICNLTGSAAKKITVTSYPGEWAVLDGHVIPVPNPDPEPQVLRIAAKNVIFKDFEVTYLNVVRAEGQPGFTICGGIKDYNGSLNCEFINLVVHDNPGDGFDTWKEAESSFVYGCIIYNNGNYMLPTIPASRRQHGPGMYVQNKSDKYKILKNNIVFNNFWIGFEVWSASTSTPLDFIKNITLDDNTMFNNGMPANSSPNNVGETNILVKTMDNNGSNVIRNINIINNVLYHNTNYAGNISNPVNVENLGEAPAMEVGNITSAFPSNNILIHNNYLSGRNPAVRINDINNLTFTNNYALGRYFEIKETNRSAGRINATNWHFDNNHYYTFGQTYLSFPGLWSDRPIRMLYMCDSDLDGQVDDTCTDDYYLPSNLPLYVSYCTGMGYNPLTQYPVWKLLFPGLDTNSTYSLFQMNLNSQSPFNIAPINYSNPPNVLKLTQNIYKPNQFKVALLLPPTSTTPTGPFTASADFSSYGIPAGTAYTIRDIESFPAIAATGTYSGSTVTFDLGMSTPPFNAPVGPGYGNAVRTPGNFGVFLIEFTNVPCVANLVVSDEVITGNNDFRQASVYLTAVNEVRPDAIASYHAPQSAMKPGFHTAYGSSFRMYTDGCTQTYNARLVPQDEVPVPGLWSTVKNDERRIENEFVIHPNPGTGVFNVETAAVAINRIVITTIDANETVFDKAIDDSLSITVDISKERKGIYIVQVYFTDKTVGTKKIIKD